MPEAELELPVDVSAQLAALQRQLESLAAAEGSLPQLQQERARMSICLRTIKVSRKACASRGNSVAVGPKGNRGGQGAAGCASFKAERPRYTSGCTSHWRVGGDVHNSLATMDPACTWPALAMDTRLPARPAGNHRSGAGQRFAQP